MRYFPVVEKFDFSRPLVFLCGPAYDKENSFDRRHILSKYIKNEWSGYDAFQNKVKTFPVIFDNLFKILNGKEKALGIKLNIIEEIITNISYRTYIFLDTMSTSYELGQFTNFSYNENLNNTVVLLEDKFDTKRKNNYIGEYICKSLEDRIITYDGGYNEKNHIFFMNGSDFSKEIPENLKTFLNTENPLNLNNGKCDVVFSRNKSDINKPGYIAFEINKDKLSFIFNIKNLFYFISVLYRETFRGDRPDLPTSLDDEKFLLFYKDITRSLFSTFVLKTENDFSHCCLLSNDFDIEIIVNGLEVKELIYHMIYLSFMFKSGMDGAEYLYDLKTISEVRRYIRFGGFMKTLIPNFFKINNLVSFHNNHINWSSGIKVRQIKIKKKTRNITSYENNEIGRTLKRIHTLINDKFLKYLPSSSNSFAYKEKLNILKCIQRHKDNTLFVKYDINKYFESISFKTFSNKLLNYICDKMERYLFESIPKNVRFIIKREFLDIIQLCFINYKLVIGFTLSPKISDFYLFEVDEKMGLLPNITYTRYADDILISSNDENSLTAACKIFENLLEEQKLSINLKKKRKGNLLKDGSAFKFLGLNILRKNNKNTITIGNKYLIETSKILCNFIKNYENNKNNKIVLKIIGRINYIKYISQDSLLKLFKIVKVKLCDDDYKTLRLFLYRIQLNNFMV